jgi:hypothetical protein
VIAFLDHCDVSDHRRAQIIDLRQPCPRCGCRCLPEAPRAVADSPTTDDQAET